MFQLKDIKKVLMTGNGSIYLGTHTKRRLVKRGYTKGDIVAALFNGRIIEYQGTHKVAVLGHDRDDNPIVIIVAQEGKIKYKIATVMPPIDHNRFQECI